MADWVKIALKTGLIIGVMTALWAIFTQIQIPNINLNGVFAGVGTAFAFINYWCPIFPTIWASTLVMLTVLVSLWTFRFAMIAVRWLFKVNE